MTTKTLKWITGGFSLFYAFFPVSTLIIIPIYESILFELFYPTFMTFITVAFITGEYFWGIVFQIIPFLLLWLLLYNIGKKVLRNLNKLKT